MREIVVKGAYGLSIKLNAELSEEAKEAFPKCVACWDDPKIWEKESFVCNHTGPCNFYPIIKEK